MPSIMADNDVDGHLEILLRVCHSEQWREIWEALDVTVESFETVGLKRNVSDRELWQACQEREIVLVTGNRNKADDSSLEATIQLLGAESNVPVLTLSKPRQVYVDREYAEQAAVRLMEYLMNVDLFRGAGRLYLP